MAKELHRHLLQNMPLPQPLH